MRIGRFSSVDSLSRRLRARRLRWFPGPDPACSFFPSRCSPPCRASPAHSQGSEGRIVGVVRDVTGGALPGASLTVANQATGGHQVGGHVHRRKLHDQPRPRRLHRDGVHQGLRPADPEGPQARRGGRAHRRLLARDHAGGGDHRHRPEARVHAAGGALLRSRTHRGGPAEARRRRPRGRGRERGQLHRAEPRPRAEPGRHAGCLGRPDRARPAGRQGAGGRLSRRVRHLALALHAGHRPLRHVPGRGAAGPAGHAFRVWLADGHGALHHQPARGRGLRSRSASSPRAP